MRIYLSGSIKKGPTDPRSSKSFWSSEDEKEIIDSVGGDTTLLNPAKSPISRNDYYANYGCDLYLVKISDAVLVDLRSEKGIGIGAEMMFANIINVPVISILPDNSYYKRDVVPDVFGEDLKNWIHPFAFGLSDIIAGSIKDACDHLRSIKYSRPLPRRSASPEDAMAYFLKLYPHLGVD